MTRVYDEDLTAAFATRAVHAGQRPDPLTGAIMTPVYLTSTYAQDGLGQNKGYEYARGKNPTREALERNVAALEGGTHGFAFSSGMGCLDSIMKLFQQGDHFVCAENMYGGTPRLFDRILSCFGLRFTYVDPRSADAIEDAIQPETKAVIVETPTNPMMRLTDLAAVGELCARRSVQLIVDNTFATPVFQRPFVHGADIVYHSSTKYLNGHSDMVGGIAIVRDNALAERLQFILNAAGAVPGPFDSWLCYVDKTLHLRMAAHDANGRRVARYLLNAGRGAVIYQTCVASAAWLAKRQMTGFGGMISVEVGAGREQLRSGARTSSPSPIVRCVEPRMPPATMTHASVPIERRQALGITDGLIRFSVGVEDVDDLLNDLEYAFRSAVGGRKPEVAVKT